MATGIALACALSACAGSHKQPTSRIATDASRPVEYSGRAKEILLLAGLGTFEGRCPQSARSWRLQFVDGQATDTISYRVGKGDRHTVTVNPGAPITWNLVPSATRTHELADRFAPPPGHGRGLSAATNVPTTLPLQATIYQATEPQTLRADVRIALSTSGGESAGCILVGSTVNADTYPNQP